jgi:hypothetical protein
VQPAKIVFETNTSNLEIEKHLIIKSQGAKPLYELRVFAVSMNNQTTDSLVLHLYKYGSQKDGETKYEPNLLNPDYWGHGEGLWVFRPKEICPANRNNTASGARRIFELRRMRIVVSLTEIEMNQDFSGITRMKVTITVQPNKTMRSRPKGIPLVEGKPCK